MGKKSKKKVTAKSQEEIQLEADLFGKPRVSLNDVDNYNKDSTIIKSLKTGISHGTDSDDEDEEGFGFSIDRDKSSTQPHQSVESGKKVGITAPVWHDEDDDEVAIDLSNTDRLKKLQKEDSDNDDNDANKVLSAKEYGDITRQRFSDNRFQWASSAIDNKRRKIESGYDEEDDDRYDLLNSAASLVVGNISKESSKSSPYINLPEGKLNIKRVANANVAESSKKCINAISFHSSGNLLLAGGQDKMLRFFQIDGQTNEKQISVRFNDIAIQSAAFIKNTDNVLVAGRKPYYYVYDTNVGRLTKLPGTWHFKLVFNLLNLQFHISIYFISILQGPPGFGLKSLEKMVLSPDGTNAALLGSGGSTHILNTRSKGWTHHLKMNSGTRSATFLNDHTVVTSGVDADIYIWDLRQSGRCMNR